MRDRERAAIRQRDAATAGEAGAGGDAHVAGAGVRGGQVAIEIDVAAAGDEIDATADRDSRIHVDVSMRGQGQQGVGAGIHSSVDGDVAIPAGGAVGRNRDVGTVKIRAQSVGADAAGRLRTTTRRDGEVHRIEQP